MWCSLLSQGLYIQWIPSFNVSLTVVLQCLNVNLGAGFIKLASASEGDWTCLLCKSAPLEKLRANLLAPLQVNGITESNGTLYQFWLCSREKLKLHSVASDQLEQDPLGHRFGAWNHYQSYKDIQWVQIYFTISNLCFISTGFGRTEACFS